MVSGDYCFKPSENQLVAMTWVPLSREHFQRVGVFVHKHVCIVHMHTDMLHINSHPLVFFLTWGYFWPGYFYEKAFPLSEKKW